MTAADPFFQKFGALNDEVHADGAISRKNKELMGLAISVISRCNERILYHIDDCVYAGASKEEMILAVETGVVGGGSLTCPTGGFISMFRPSRKRFYRGFSHSKRLMKPLLLIRSG